MPVASFPEYARQLSADVMDIVSSGQARLTDLQVAQRSVQRGYITGILILKTNQNCTFVNTSI